MVQDLVDGNREQYTSRSKDGAFFTPNVVSNLLDNFFPTAPVLSGSASIRSNIMSGTPRPFRAFQQSTESNAALMSR